MAYNKFSLGILVRVLLIFALLLVITSHWDPDRHFFTLLVSGASLLILMAELIHYLNKVNRELARFLDTIRDKGLTSRSISITDLPFRGLNRSFNRVLDAIQEANMKREGQHHLLEMIVEQAQTGIILVRPEGKIEIMNPAATEILGLAGPANNLAAIQKENPEAHEVLSNDGHANTFTMETGQKNGSGKHISGTKSQIRIMDQPYLLITFQDISRNIEQTETEAWQKLIRTLSHEMMNSTTPISSLAETSLHILEDEKTPPGPEQTRKLKKALQAIEKRSTGLYGFVDQVRQLVKLPAPKKEDFPVSLLIEDVSALVAPELEKADIHLEKDIHPPRLMIHADRPQIEQVLINLLLNARQALQEAADPHIHIQALAEDGYTKIVVSDNGKGLDPETLGKIFIPFYSTSPKGSGIGLSLSRQIMQNHEGKLTVNSTLDDGSSFTLWFPSTHEPVRC